MAEAGSVSVGGSFGASAALVGLILLRCATVFAQAPPDPPAAPSANPVLQLRGFGDVQLRASDGESPNTTFAVGQLDLFMTSALGDSFSVLAEAVIEANPENQFGFELERAQLQYFPNDHLKLILGRYHANIGYYSTAYHHGTWFQTAVGRPRLFGFEDQGGALPIHDVGISATGLIPDRKSVV